MPHITVKMYPGRGKELKQRVSDELTKALVNALGIPETAVSDSIQDVEKEKWDETVVQTEIVRNPECVFKKPGENLKGKKA